MSPFVGCIITGEIILKPFPIKFDHPVPQQLHVSSLLSGNSCNVSHAVLVPCINLSKVNTSVKLMIISFIAFEQETWKLQTTSVPNNLFNQKIVYPFPSTKKTQACKTGLMR